MVARLTHRLPMVLVLLVPAAWLACGIGIVGTAADAPPTPNDDAGPAPSGSTPTPAVSDASVVSDGAPDGGLLGDGGPIGCPGTAGPTMVDVGGSCIDSTEVTEAQYAAFLAESPKPGAPETGRGLECAWKTSFLPDAGTKQVCRWDPSAYPNLPVVCVDWCDAFAYCRWAGKRLCGANGGGSIAWSGDDYKDPKRDQWYRACSKDGLTRYPYGTTFHKDACNGKEHDAGGVLDAGSLAECLGGYSGLYDMVGNAFEFEDSCRGTGKDDPCRLRGGSWFQDDGLSNCLGYGAGNKRSDRFDDIGFRCCSP